ncbi:MAG: pyridoxine 5'-phosphate synthase [Betaproteobacteria bacterium RIFCSPLOWO2_02_64_14]|nr:MAG: pyridoxine 5'-phosphate synthase [Betaproteobacteria bacterium RIFCSPLOWO2_02_64_14]
MTRLSVNLNKVALLRNSRTLGIPSVTWAARAALDAGAHGITVHPRPDGRHIRPHDVIELAALLKDEPRAEFNVEGNPAQSMMELTRAVRPHQCTLVPDEPDAFTSDHGWDLAKDGERLAPVIAELKALGVRVSLFMDPVPGQMAAARAAGADRVELYTEPYARAFGTAAEGPALETYARATRAAAAANLGVNAGHDLNLKNLARFLACVPGVLEVSIGHALTADALEMGLAAAVRRYLQEIERGSAGQQRDHAA